MSNTQPHPFCGTWRIVDMEMWDADYLDMEVPAFLTILPDLTGEFQFGLVRGEVDGRLEAWDDETRFDFSWSGFEEMDPVSGRGWLLLDGDVAQGRFYFHLGDDSGITVERLD